MLFRTTILPGVFVIANEMKEDERGFFTRTYCAREFALNGIDTHFVQCNLSFNRKRGVVRGLHFQHPPHTEAKLIRCTRGSIYDVAVDLRPSSPTYAKHIAIELSARNGLSFYLPKGLAHGFQTLEDETEIFYQMGAYYAPDAAAGIRYDDPEIGISWPLPEIVISERDRTWPSLASWKNPFTSDASRTGV